MQYSSHHNMLGSSLLLAHDGMEPRAFFDEVYPLIQAEGAEAACLALTNFVRMIITISDLRPQDTLENIMCT